MARGPRSTPKKPGPYRAPPSLTYTSPPLRHTPGLNTPTPKPPLSTAKVARWRTPFFAVAGTFAFGIAFYTTSLYISTTKGSSCSHATQSLTAQKDVSAVYDTTASSFDAEVGLSEFLGGIMRARKKLAKQCRGDVLEVSAGTGRNLGYYRFGEKGIQSLTLVDLSQSMVDEARKKWDVLNKGQKMALGHPVRFLQGDCAGSMPGPPVGFAVEGSAGEKKMKEKEKDAQVEVAREGGKKGYDTIIQTMGLCSTPSPVQLLKNLASHLNTENEEAHILLLEHGRSYYQWLNRILDSQAPKHADIHGCWWNREIGDIVEESGLEIVKERRKHFGTTWIFELRPAKDKSLREKATDTIEKVEEKLEQSKIAADAKQKTSWFWRS